MTQLDPAQVMPEVAITSIQRPGWLFSVLENGFALVKHNLLLLLRSLLLHLFWHFAPLHFFAAFLLFDPLKLCWGSFALGKLKSIRYLGLESNKLIGTIPQSIYNLY